MYVLGIDAGGTKTTCLLADERGAIISEARAGGANLQARGELEVEKVLHTVMDLALGDRDLRPDVICVGIAGVDRPRDAEAVRGIMRRIGHKSRVLVVNDALIALVAGAGDGCGLVVISGTGSIAYARDAAGRAARAGGWGHLLGDEGSGYWIGREALAAVVRQYDRRGPPTALTAGVLHHFGLSSPTDLIHTMYDPAIEHRALAMVARTVADAADAGDGVARGILTRAADELAAAAGAALDALGMRDAAFPTVLAGSALRSMPLLAAEVTGRLASVARHSHVRLLDVEPAAGAVRLALAEARGQAPVPHYV
jgi:N-acetylglucosamine kinase-like BadF-type ATPase